MYVMVDNNKYWLEEYGEGAPVFLLHGFTGSTTTWQELLPCLTAGFRVFLLDLPGHGKTKVNNPIEMEQFCREFSLILDQLKINKTHLAGYSLGGRTALSYAVNFPERVASLILESASPGLETEWDREKRRQSDQQLSLLLMQGDIDSFVNKWESLPLFHTQKSLPEATRKKIRQERLSQCTEGLAASLVGMGTGSQPSWWSHLDTLFLPILLLAGARDTKFLGLNKRMAATLPNAELVVLEEAGHCLHVEQPEIFGTIVDDFLSKHRNEFRMEG